MSLKSVAGACGRRFHSSRSSTGMSARKREAHHGYVTSRPDGDNVIKLIGDALNNIVWRDDSQIVVHSVSKLYGDTPKTVIRVSEVLS